MNYSEFSDLIRSYLWRDGDTTFNVDLFVKMGEDRLNRDLKIQRMEQTSTVLSVVAQTSAMPNDYRQMQQVYRDDTGEPFGSVPMFELMRQRTAQPSSVQPIYAVSNRNLLLAGPMSVEEPISLVLVYSAKVPDFKATDNTWLLDEEYSDLYIHAVLRHTGMYMRDDARVALWKSEYQEVLDSVLADDRLRRWPGGQLIMPMPEGVA